MIGGGGTVTEIPKVGFYGQIVSGIRGVKHFFRINRHIGGSLNDGGGRCIFVFVNVRCRNRLRRFVLKYVDRLNLIGIGDIFFCSDRINKAVLPFCIGSARTEQVKGISVFGPVNLKA